MFFTITGVFIRQGYWNQTALQSGPRERGTLLQDLCLGNMGYLEPTSLIEQGKSCRCKCPHLTIVCLWLFDVCCLPNKLASHAARIASSQYSWRSPEEPSRSSRLIFARYWSSYRRSSTPNSSCLSISCRISSLRAVTRVPIALSCICTHRCNHWPWVASNSLITRPSVHWRRGMEEPSTVE
jgi:hypothetical protein